MHALFWVYDIYSALVSSWHYSSDEFRSQLILLEKDNDRLLKIAYTTLLSLGWLWPKLQGIN